jgi:RNA polymerase primary sigma factor
MTHAQLEANSLGADNSMRQYLEDIRSIPMLSREDEVSLATRSRQGDESARARLVQSNLRFVISIAKRYQHRGLSLVDLVAEGNVGLVKAVDRFDETLGFKFISYAVWWIKQAIIQAISRQARPMRLPSARANLLYKIEKANGKLEQEQGRSVDWIDLADEVDSSENDVRDMLLLQPRVSSLDGGNGDDDVRLLEIVSDDDAASPHETLESQNCCAEIVSALKALDERERVIVEKFFGLADGQRHTLEQIGKDFRLTRERIRQIKDRALRKLRHFSRSAALREYLVA